MKKTTIFQRVIIQVILTSILSIGCATTAVSYTPPITDDKGDTIPGSITTMEKMIINGVEQWVLIRGEDTGNPVLLYLHGGPGISYTPWRELFIPPELEKEFTIVIWDQRGAGKSYSPDLTDKDLEITNYIEDIKDLTEHLKQRFNQDKIFMIGHSWGSALGFMTLMATPNYKESYYAYIACGEAAHWNRRQTISFQWTLEEAGHRNWERAESELLGLGEFNPENPTHVSIKNKWLSEMGGDFKEKTDFQRYMAALGSTPEYTAADVALFQQGVGFTTEATALNIHTSGYDLFSGLPEVKIPLYFFTGRYDRITPADLALEYFEAVKAPVKEFIWFEDSAHYMIFREYQKAARELIRIKGEILE